MSHVGLGEGAESANRYALIATDLDGTLLRSDLSVSDRTRNALNAAVAAGMRLVFTTGRPPRWMPPVAEATGHSGTAVCANGALVYDMATEKVIGHNLLEPLAARAVVDALRGALPEISFAVERPDRFGTEPIYRTRYRLPDDSLVASLEELLDRPVAKLLARHDGMTADALLDRAMAVAGDLATFTHSGAEGLLEVSASGVTKALALEQVARGYSIAAAGVVAFGDSPNDLPMLAWAGLAVAVANAHPHVLAAVDEVTASNDDDGVAVVIERLLSE